MSILSWGRCTIYTAPATETISESSWNALPTPKEDSTDLSSSPGKKEVATEEGGGIVDVRYSRNSYTLTFELFVIKGMDRPFTDNDGIIAGEHAFRVVPEDDKCEGILIERAVVRCDESFKSATGKMLKYTVEAIKPKTGNTVKPYVVGA